MKNTNFKDDDDTYVLYTHPQRRSYGLGYISNDNFPKGHIEHDSEEDDGFVWDSDESNSEEINSFEDFNKIHHK